MSWKRCVMSWIGCGGHGDGNTVKKTIASMRQLKCAFNVNAEFVVDQASGARKPKELVWVVLDGRWGFVAANLGGVIGNRLLKIGSSVCPKACCNISSSLEV